MQNILLRVYVGRGNSCGTTSVNTTKGGYFMIKGSNLKAVGGEAQIGYNARWPIMPPVLIVGSKNPI